jgi:hypothetical protein
VDDAEPPRWQRRLAGGGLAVAAALVVGAFAALALDDRGGAFSLLLLLGVITVPVLGAALLSLAPAVALLVGGPAPPRTVACAGLLAVGHLGVVAVALQPDVQPRISGGEQLGAAVGGVGLGCAVVVLAVLLPGRSFGLRLVTGLSAAVLALALLVLRGVAAAT